MRRSIHLRSAAARATTTTAARLTLAAGLLAAAAIAAPARGQLPAANSPASTGFEMRPFVGALIHTGAQRDVLDNAVLTGAQLGYRFNPNVALTGSFGWTPTRDRTGAAFAAGAAFGSTRPRIDLFQYDLGIEGRLPGAGAVGVGRQVLWFSPYVGIGAGARTYHYRDLAGTSDQTNVAGHAALGLDVGLRDAPWGVRFEARDDMSAFKGLRGERADRTNRNDVALAAGLTYRF